MKRKWNPLHLFTVVLSAVGAAAALLSVVNNVSASKPDTVMWAGHQVVFGETILPMLGKRETRSDSYVLAEVTRKDGRLSFVQKACRVDFKEVMGAKIHICEKALLALPAATFSFSKVGQTLQAAPWQVGWGRQDVDNDGKPGLTVKVDAPVCGGKLLVSSYTRSAAVGQLLENGNGMFGKINVRVQQKILDADSACLRLFAGDSDETQSGVFVYRRVPDNATCEDLLKRPWPIKAKTDR